MAESFLPRAVQDVPALRAVFITAMPDCLLYDSWLRTGESWTVEKAATYFGDLIRANREGLRSLSAWSEDLQITIESATTLIILRELNDDFSCGFIFDLDIPLGLARLHLEWLLARIRTHLPDHEPTMRPKGVRLMEMLRRYAPDPHAVLLRVALRTGIPTESLEAPERLDDEHIAQVEEAAKRILGLQELNL